VPLGEACQFGVNDEQLGWVIAQALNGGLPVVRWDEPYNVASLWVDQQRLRQLATWPSSEPGFKVPPSANLSAQLDYFRRLQDEQSAAELAASKALPGSQECDKHLEASRPKTSEKEQLQ
jgi:hypothetical protein